MHSNSRKGPRPLGEAISQLIAERGLAGSSGLVTMNELWKEIVGDDIGQRTKVTGIKNGTLEIGVKSSALLNELVGFYSDEFLELIRADDRGKAVRSIRFRLKR
jgi:predicted nucleic acid-binding Zn ribbon protein